MENHWLYVNRHRSNRQFHWVFAIGKNSVYQLTPREVKVKNRPDPKYHEGEMVVITFNDITSKDTELFDLLANYYLGEKQNGHYAYLRLVDDVDQPIETWSLDQIKVEDVIFGNEVEVSFSFKSKEYRDFLRKIEIYTSKSV